MCNTTETPECFLDIADQGDEKKPEASEISAEDLRQATTSPNKETLLAMEAADRGQVIGPFDTVEDLIEALNDGSDE